MPPASASAVNNNNNNASNAATQAAAKAEREERLRGALKVFIQKDRQRKKEEFEAKVEEERLRKEREARERQNDMTLGETREQISKLDQKLNDLRNQKQQLFLQLKKVLNEDENRKKQQKDNEMFAMQALQAQQANLPQPQVFLPPRLQHHQMPILPKVGRNVVRNKKTVDTKTIFSYKLKPRPNENSSIFKPVGNQSLKRGRSPSPPTHQGYYKNANYLQQKHDDGRRGADYARILWNKPPTQYQNPPGTLFYQTTNNAPPPQQDARGPAIIYPTYNPALNLPLRQGPYHMDMQQGGAGPPAPGSKNDPQKAAQVYHINIDQPPISQANNGPTAGPQKPQVTMEKLTDRGAASYHVEVKHDAHGPPPHLPDGVVYAPLIPGMTIHPSAVMQITGNPVQNPKSGSSINQGYPPPPRNPAHDQQLARQQQQMSVIPGQPGPPTQQQLHYPRRLF